MSKELVAGQKILQYEVISTIGTGGMSRVYVAQDQVLNRRVALKQVLTEDGDSRSVIRLQQEGQSLARLSHPNIVKILTFFTTDDGAPFLVMELLHGCSLSEFLSKSGSLSVGETLQLAACLCDALQHAHDEGIVHRDIKPSNIFLCNKKIDSPKIIDFGIAKIADTSVNATRTGEFMGSPAYLSPEQALQKKVTAQSDQYSLACVLYECLSGHPPFEDETAMALILKHINDTAAPLGKKSFVPPTVAKAIDRALQKEPEFRFASMTDFKNALEGRASDTSKKRLAKPILIAAAVVLVSASALALTIALNAKQSTQVPVAATTAPVALSAPTAAEDEPKRFQGLNDERRIRQNILRDPDITRMDLKHYFITKSSLDALAGAKKLSILGLEYTDIDDSAGDYIARIRTLEQLFVANTAIGDEFVKKLSSLPRLLVLSLGETKVTDACGIFLRKLRTLNQVWFRSNDITDAVGDDLANLPALELLDVAKCSVGDLFVEKISRLPKLNYLAIGESRITNKCLPSLGKLRSLRSIYLDNPDGAIDDISSLKGLPLVVLSLRGANITKNTVAQIVQFKTLQTLRLDKNAINGEDLIRLASLPKLHDLAVTECELLTNEDIAKFRKLRPDCQLRDVNRTQKKHSAAAEDIINSVNGLEPN